MKPTTASEAVIRTTAPKIIDASTGLRRSLRHYALDVFALIVGAAIWESLGWGLGLQWLPPFSQVMEALLQFLTSGAILSNLDSSLSSLCVGFALSLVFGLRLGALMG